MRWTVIVPFLFLFAVGCGLLRLLIGLTAAEAAYAAAESGAVAAWTIADSEACAIWQTAADAAWYATPWKFLGQLCRKAGLGDEPRRVLAELSELRTVDVILSTKTGPKLRTRCTTQPTAHQKTLLDHMGWKLPESLRPMEM